MDSTTPAHISHIPQPMQPRLGRLQINEYTVMPAISYVWSLLPGDTEQGSRDRKRLLQVRRAYDNMVKRYKENGPKYADLEPEKVHEFLCRSFVRVLGSKKRAISFINRITDTEKEDISGFVAVLKRIGEGLANPRMLIPIRTQEPRKFSCGEEA